jgi:5'-3' exonuclease
LDNRKKILIVDGMNLVKRCYHAIPSRKNNEGMEVNSLYGFIRTLINEQSIFKFAGHIVVFDSRTGSGFRKEIYPEYKANRKPKTEEEARQREEVNEQVQHLVNILRYCGIPVLMHKKFEADDVIASLVQVLKDSYHLYILSADKDLFQLIEEKVWIIKPGLANGTKMIVTPKEFQKMYPELESPKNMFDLKVLSGDFSDNIKGLTRVGEKTALKLLASHKSVQNIYENLDSLEEKYRNLVQKERDIIDRNKLLISLVKDIPISEDRIPIRVPSFYSPEIKDIYKEYNIDPWG